MNHWCESELEDFLSANPEIVFGEGAVVYGRQVRCIAGIIDLIIGIHHSLYIVELKAKTATKEDVGQVCRYAETVRRHIYDTHVELMSPMDDPHGFSIMADVGDYMQIEPILIAPDFDRNVPEMCSCYAAISDPDGFLFEHRGSVWMSCRFDGEEPELSSIIDKFGKTLIWGQALCAASLRMRERNRYRLPGIELRGGIWHAEDF